MTFCEIVESVKKLSTEEKDEIKLIVEHYLIEEKREEIYTNYLLSQKREKEGKLKFYFDINELINSLEE